MSDQIGQYSLTSNVYDKPHLQHHQFHDIRDRDLDKAPIQQITITTKPDNTWWILLAISLIILFIFWIYLTYLSLESVPKLISTGQTGVEIICPVNQCATNIYNGEKRCPTSGQTIISDAATEICVTAGLCDNSRNPYAVQSDQSTNINGTCEIDPSTGQPTTCRCLPRPQCPNYVLAGWETYSGNAFVGLNQQRTSFTQFTASDADANNIISNNAPLSYADDGTKFCLAPLTWVARGSPGCPFMTLEGGVDISANEVTVCMGTSQDCTAGFPTSNPCSRGTLAFVTPDSDSFTKNSINLVPLGCVNGDPCPCGQVAVYDTMLGGIVCKTISTPPTP